jgi:hypothetical protein
LTSIPAGRIVQLPVIPRTRANRSNRPLPPFPISTGTGGERQKADVGATGGMRQQRSSLKQAAARASSTQTGHKASHLPSASSTARRDDFCSLET